jgi:hypothetical protein
MHKNAMKCNKTLSKWCKNKHGASKIMDTFETYQDSQKEEEDAHRSEHTTATGMNLSSVYDLLEGCAEYFCISYPETCDKCRAVGHFNFQCPFTFKESSVYTRVEVLEYLVYIGVRDLLLRKPIISDGMLRITFSMLPNIESYFHERLSN